MIPTTQAGYNNGTQYQIELRRDDGTRLKIIDNVGGFNFTSAVNDVGRFSITLPADFDRTLIAIDRRVQFWRRPPGGGQYLEFQGLIRGITTSTSETGATTRQVYGFSLAYLLSGRVIAAAAQATNAVATAEAADDLCKRIVKNELGSSASAARALSSTCFSTAVNTTLGPTLTRSFSYDALLSVLQRVAEAARTAGTELYFDVVSTGETTFEFKTFTGQRGQDRTGGGKELVFELGRNLLEPQLDENWENEVNYAYALGQGVGTDRMTATAEAATRSTLSLFARRESAVNANTETTAAGLADTADARILAGRPVTTFTGKLLSLSGSIYGLDWGFGDRVKINYDGLQFTAMVRAVTIAVNGEGYESIDAMTESYL